MASRCNATGLDVSLRRRVETIQPKLTPWHCRMTTNNFLVTRRQAPTRVTGTISRPQIVVRRPLQADYWQLSKVATPNKSIQTATLPSSSRTTPLLLLPPSKPMQLASMALAATQCRKIIPYFDVASPSPFSISQGDSDAIGDGKAMDLDASLVPAAPAAIPLRQPLPP